MQDQVQKKNRTFGGECRSYDFAVPQNFRPFTVPTTATYAHVDTFGATLEVDFFYGSSGEIIIAHDNICHKIVLCFLYNNNTLQTSMKMEVDTFPIGLRNH